MFIMSRACDEKNAESLTGFQPHMMLLILLIIAVCRMYVIHEQNFASIVVVY